MSAIKIRLEQDIAAKVASLEAEKQENDAIRKSLVEAQERNDELFKKVRDSEYKAHQLQDTVQKLVFLLPIWLCTVFCTKYNTIIINHHVVLWETNVFTN